MYSGGNLGDQEVAAREAARDQFLGMGELPVFGRVRRGHRAVRQHRRPVERDNEQRLAARQERNAPYHCPFCRTPLNDDQFLAHLEICPGALSNHEKKLATINNFCSSPGFLHHQLSKLKETCELSFFEGKLNPEKRVNMACRLCKSVADHLAGRCMADEQKSVFDAEANKIASQVLLHFEQTLNRKKQTAINRLNTKNAQYFDTVEGLLSAEPRNLDAWLQFEETTKKQHIEKSELINSLDMENQRELETYKTCIRAKIEAVANNMNEYITSNKTNFRQLRQVVAERRAHGEQVGQDAQEPPSGISEEEASQLEAFFANIKIAGIKTT